MFREYLVPMMTGIFHWSQIGQTANPMVSETENLRIGKDYYYLPGNNIKKGQRMDVLNVRNDIRRAKIIRMIIANQTNARKNSYCMVGEDPRFDNEDPVPFPAGGASRPILCDDPEYRTTFIR